mmetsp:Transcript_134405/g.287524  ORF Transcript_134405/g.287524 Transcript_134405/m.287524 type:complete len:112 (-) Transcript_134405:31-366(-)
MSSSKTDGSATADAAKSSASASKVTEPSSGTAKDKQQELAAGEDDPDVDPLDAFMAGMQEQLVQERNEPPKRKLEAENPTKGAVAFEARRQAMRNKNNRMRAEGHKPFDFN